MAVTARRSSSRTRRSVRGKWKEVKAKSLGTVFRNSREESEREKSPGPIRASLPSCSLRAVPRC
ncbi:hypothetical protein SCNRRL3882_7001 [Streptomyces chartreusis NRRL 3882]|uniref:Uncharacterized protein n=1 Tax=Streptomyces chartreusis NRRL 3882 TaxID=1079985 RepID=A0A2N9BJM6_STRCX|nr:hypothetical protein SCNRRL3882_7001 [Streptomyces chartreusis NRRL 3882]